MAITYLSGGRIQGSGNDKASLVSSTSTSYGTVSFAGGISGNPDTRNLVIPTNPLQDVTDGGDSNSAFTISFWVLSNSGIDSNDAFMGTMDGASGNPWHFQIRITDGDGLEIMNGSTYARWGTDYTRASINNNAWHHIALTRPASSSVVTAYLDGVDKGDETYTGRFNSNLTYPRYFLTINGRGDNTGVAGVMSIQDLGFWTRELSGADIAVLATGKPIDKATLAIDYKSGLTSYYKFDGDYTDSNPSPTFTPEGSFNVEYLVVGGGAGAAIGNGGGGGAGALRTNVSGATNGGGGSAEAVKGVTAQTYSITVGTGSAGVGDQSGGGGASHGAASVFDNITADGGAGSGRGGQNAPSYSGNGSGGGAGNGASGSDGGTYGYNGGDSSHNDAAGGGGSSANGVNGDASNAGAGGAGTANSITGTSVTYAGGGGGAAQNGSAGAGGSGGGGAGNNSGRGNNATGFGSGGGGGASSLGGFGSDGTVVLKFVTANNPYSQVGGLVDTTTTSGYTIIRYQPKIASNTGANGAGVSIASSGGKFDTYLTYTSNLPTGTRFEQTNDRKIFRMKDGNWVEKGTA